ncbi:MAG: apolipoprotein N-acyltransferase [Vicinamibacterales bacterium]
MSGVLLALSFPRFGLPAVAWVALAPLMVSVQRGTLRDSFLKGLLTGVVYFTGTLYWISNVMAMYGDMSVVVAVLINALLIAYLALFPALFALVLRRFSMVLGPRSLALAPFAWVATELGRMYIMTGFPWVLLGYSQVTFVPVAQFASLFGVFGLSGLIASVSAALAYTTVRGRLDTATTGRAASVGPYVPLAATIVLVVIVGAWGAIRVSRGDLTRDGDAVTVGLVQGNVDQADKWNPTRASSIFRQYLDMTRNAIGRGAQMVLWPESSTPFFLEEDRAGAEQIRAIARQARVPILLGSDQIESNRARRRSTTTPRSS